MLIINTLYVKQVIVRIPFIIKKWERQNDGDQFG